MLRRLRKSRRKLDSYDAVVGNDDFPSFESTAQQVAEGTGAASMLNEFTIYQKLVVHLYASEMIEVVPLHSFVSANTSDAIQVSLRHDIDADPWTALRSARFLARYGMPGSFFILHTAGYYGRWDGNCFNRNPAIGSLIRDLVVTGMDIGLHIDPLGLMLDHGIDGVEAMRTELTWIRSHGASVSGVVAHNSAAAYGAENFEIFQGLAAGDRREVRWKEQTLPLQKISLQELDLEYEGNHPLPRKKAPSPGDKFFDPPKDAVRDPEWLQRYLVDHPVFDRAYEYSVWLLGRDQWAIAGHGSAAEFHWPLNLEQVLLRLDDCSPGSRVVFTIHPMYVAGT